MSGLHRDWRAPAPISLVVVALFLLGSLFSSQMKISFTLSVSLF
jgi:hypothetical protein